MDDFDRVLQAAEDQRRKDWRAFWAEFARAAVMFWGGLGLAGCVLAYGPTIVDFLRSVGRS